MPSKHRCAFLISLNLALLISTSVLAQQSGSMARITVNPRERFQFIDGFGANIIGPWFRDDQKATFDMLIGDLGATKFRVGAYLVYSNWEAINMHDNPELAARGLSANSEYWNNRYSSAIFETSWALMRYLNSRGIRPLIALYGPVPDWMTDDMVGPLDKAFSLDELYNKRQNHLTPKMYDAFAEEVVSMLAYARNQAHVDFTYFSPFNETDAFPTQGPRIDPGEVSNVLDAVARQLRKDGLVDVKLAVADQAEPARDYIRQILKDTELMKQVGAFTLHIYRDNDAVGSQIEHIKESKYPQIPVWITEYGELDDLNRTAENEWKGFSISAERRGLKALNQGARTLLIWDALDEYDDSVQRLCYYGLFRSAGHLYAPKKRYYAAKQLYHFIAPGSQRIAATTVVSGVTVSAFRNVQMNSLIVVGVKEGGPNHIHVTVSEGESVPATWDVYETTREVDCLKVDSVSVKDGDAELDLPEEAIFTLVGALPKLR